MIEFLYTRVFINIQSFVSEKSFVPRKISFREYVKEKTIKQVKP